jgi:NAD(P)-dependent dehydrogenase (short-subunit alcohol dehydrogenase family)
VSGRVAGKVVVVTGAGQGQGATEARLLAAEGATMIGCDVKSEPAEDLPGVAYRQLDVTDAEDWAALAADLQHVDGIQALTPLMTGGGSVVVVGSVAALTGHFPIAYTASKWALRGLAKAACLELGPRGIRVNTVHPGYIETPMTASAAPAFRDANVAETPLGRTGTVDEVAPLVLFLVSDESSFISGAEIPVHGGLTAHGGVKSISDAVRASS